MEKYRSKQKKRATTNHTNYTNKEKILFFIKKMIASNSFVIFVLFVVKKWGVVGKTIRNFVVKSFGVKLCRLCVLCGNISLSLGV